MIISRSCKQKKGTFILLRKELGSRPPRALPPRIVCLIINYCIFYSKVNEEEINTDIIDDIDAEMNEDEGIEVVILSSYFLLIRLLALSFDRPRRCLAFSLKFSSHLLSI